jgi:hypothetical protein
MSQNDNPLDVFEGESGKKLWIKLCERIEVDPKAPQHPLGSGTQGLVFELPDGSALKLTLDRQEAKAAALVARKPDPKGNVVHAYTVLKVVNNDTDIAIWAIVMEKLKRLPPGDPFAEYADAWGRYQMCIHPKNLDGFFDEVGVEFQDGPKWKEFCDWLADVAEYLKGIGVMFHDLWSGNVMMRGNQHVLIDLGYSQSMKEAPIDVVSRMLALAKQVEHIT